MAGEAAEVQLWLRDAWGNVTTAVDSSSAPQLLLEPAGGEDRIGRLAMADPGSFVSSSSKVFSSGAKASAASTIVNAPNHRPTAAILCSTQPHVQAAASASRSAQASGI